MAELELTIAYKTKPARVGLILMGALMPVWALIVPFCLGLFLGLILLKPGQVSPLITMLVLMGLAVIPIISVVVTALCEDDRLLVSKEGLAFPLFMLPGLGFRRERLWSDLSHVRLIWNGTSNYSNHDMLLMYFRSGGCAQISLKDVSKADLEQLFLALEIWGANAQKVQEVTSFQNLLQNENKGLEHLSYTQMWEEELSRRFNATAFVPLEPGKTLQSGQLKIVRQLAFGGLSAIYLAQRDNLELVVVKEAVVPANSDQQSKDKATELFYREAQFLMRLNHPQVAKVLNYFVDDGRNYMLLEYIHGQDLRQLVKQHGAQSEAKVLSWARQIVDILLYLHGQDPPIVHRDLTPDNLVLREDGDLVLIDFGAANEFVGTATGTLVGKQAYIAPEQFRGKATTQSDIYAFGGTLYFLLTGHDPEALCQSHPRERNQDVSDKVDQLVAACTNLELSQRVPTAKEALEVIAEITTKQPVSELT
ncbi:MAG: serine/threonine protein kinase [Candidatus Melainabacteria bacterium]|nr:serine/threonine protein kinase [Candidatus Melainabacteria bacterium]